MFRFKFALRSLVFPVTTFNYLNELAKLPFLPQLLKMQGLLPAKPHRPYLRAGFSVAQRAQACLTIMSRWISWIMSNYANCY